MNTGRVIKLHLNVIFICISVFVFAQKTNQDYIITKRLLTIENVRASRQITAGLQDSEGFVWLSTGYGLQRYDGKNFRLFTQDKDGLQNNQAVSISESDDNLLWLKYTISSGQSLNNGKVDIINLKTYEINSLTNFFKEKLPFPEENVNAITANEKREIIILVKNQDSSFIFLYSKKTGFKKLRSTYAASLCCPLMFKGNKLFYGTEDHRLHILSTAGETTEPALNRANLAPIGISKTDRFYFHSLPKEPKIITNALISELFVNGNYSELPNQFFETPEEHTIAGFILAFHDPTTGYSILYSRNKGIYLFDEGTYLSLTDKDINTQLNVVYDYFTVNGQHWVCTNNGVYIITVKKNFFRHYFNAGSVEQTTMDNPFQVRSIYGDEGGNLIVNCWKGLYRITNLETLKPTYERLLKNKLTAYDGFYVDNNRNLWIGGLKNKKKSGLIRYNLNTGKLSEYFYPAGDLWAAIQLNDKFYLGGFTTGILTLKDDTVQALPGCAPFLIKSNTDWVYQFFKSSDKKLWAVTKNGLYELDAETGCIKKRHSSDEKDKRYYLPFTDLHYVHEDKQGIFWLATNGEGLIRWDRKTNSFKKFSVSNGFSSNVIYAILEDEKNYLWLSSNYGIMCFDPLTYDVNIYTIADGLTADECNRISYFKSAKGQFFFGGINGINAFYPKDFWAKDNGIQPPLRIISYSQFKGAKKNLENKTYELLRNNQIVLQPDDDFFNIEFQLLNFEQDKNYFAYKIEGIDTNWIEISENSIRISDLPYGNYKLIIKGRSQTGSWSGKLLQIPVFVLKPFYYKWWFILLSIVAVLLIIFLLISLRTRQLNVAKVSLENIVTERTGQLKHITEKQEQLLKEKDVLLKEIHHRVKNNLQVISALLEMQGMRTEDKRIAAAISESQNRVLSISFIHQNLYQHDNLEGVHMRSFVKELATHINNVFKLPGCEINVSISFPDITLDIDTALPFGLILNELFTNSYKYAFPNITTGIITLELKEMQKGVYYFKYHDNGIGLPEGFEIQKTNSLGLKLVKQLSRQLGGNISYTFEKGSKFELTFNNLEVRNEQI